MNDARRSGLLPTAQGAIFAAIALALCWVPLAFTGQEDGSVSTAVLTLIRMSSPLLAALILRKLITREGFADSGLGVRGIPAITWVLALGLPAAWLGLSLAANLALGIVRLEAAEVSAGGLLLGLATTLLWIIPEEIGWRGTLLTKLLPLGRHKAFIVLGVVWFAWHPQMLLGEQAWTVSLLYLVDVVLLSYALGWIYLKAGSVWPCALLHAAHNSLTDPLVTSPSSPGGQLAEEAVFTGVLASVVTALWLLGHDPTGPGEVEARPSDETGSSRT